MIRPVQDRLEQIHRDLGWKALNPWWAKIEIVGGLAAAGVGIAILAQSPADADLLMKAGGLAAFVLGAYLAMAGHRSHLYQSNNALAAWVVQALKEPSGPDDRTDMKDNA